MLIKNEKPLAAISYDTQTYGQLRQFITTEEGLELVRIDPNDFLSDPTQDYQYINLVVKDFDQRKEVSAMLDQHNLDRFTYIGEDAIATHFHAKSIHIGKGCMLFPAVWGYSGSIADDVIMHGLVKMAENVCIGKGSFLSGAITLAGGCTIGEWCFLGNNLFFIDHVSICNDVKLLPGTNLRKSITESGTYYNPHTYKVEKILV